MRTTFLFACSIALLFPDSSRGDTLAIEVTQTGGFFPTSASNSVAFQNYFVGYGTTPGFARTDERRNFFTFSLGGVTGPITSATLSLELPFGGLIFGKGPGDPLAGPVPSDPVEFFQLTATPFSASAVTTPGLPVPTISAIFDSFAGPPIAAPVEFMLDTPPPSIIEIVLSPLGVSYLNGSLGGEVVLAGYMPSWSFDSRLSPSPPPLFFEASELIFGLTDVHTGAVAKPLLTVEFAPVPEPGLLSLALCGLVYSLRRRTTA